MIDPRHVRLRRIFDEALELPKTERAAFLARECGDDASLKAQVETLLAAAEDERFLAAPTALGSEETAPLFEGPGTRIGPYKLLQRIGEGGFGAVFMAEQERPVVRKVALKIIKLGMDTRQVVARFEQERQALALMDHPNIARVIDAGATDTGRPYFVMELVKGEPIAEYCDTHNLPIDERLALFEQVCNAVQHAHSKGIIHRDLKPSNILVGTQDGKPHAKIIDFGIAKATSAKLTDKTLFTEHQQVIGTLQYMSPEQAAGSLDIDTRTDVYALGVVLYELLTGSTPFDTATLRDAVYSEIQRIIREVEPPKPSTRLSQSADTLANIAARRRVEPKRLGTLVRGELDWIVMKALEKDRARRYDTPSSFADDIRRYLSGAAVSAAPPSTAYRVRTFIRRNRLVVSAASAVAAALLIGVVGFAWQARAASRQRDLAVEAGTKESEQRRIAEAQRKLADEQRDRAVKAEAEAEVRATELQKVADFQAEMLDGIDPTRAGRALSADVLAKLDAALAKANFSEAERKARVATFEREWVRVNAGDVARGLIDRTILEPAIRSIDVQFADQPSIDARLRQALAFRYDELGLYDAALPLQEAALATRRRVLGEEHPDTLTSIGELGTLLEKQGKLAEAEAYRREGLEKSRRVLGEEDPDTLHAIMNMGMVLLRQGKREEAAPYYREALEKSRRVLGSEHPDTLNVLNNWGAMLKDEGRLEEAEPYYRESLDTCRRVLGEDHEQTLRALGNLGTLLVFANELSEAEVYLRQALEGRRRVLGEEHPETLHSLISMGWLLQAQGKIVEAEPFLRESLEKRRRVLGDDHPWTLGSANSLGLLLQYQGKLDEAEPYFVEASTTMRRVLGPQHPDTLNAIHNLGLLRIQQARYADAVELLAPIEADTRTAFTGPNAYWVAQLLMNLGNARASVARDTRGFAAAEANLLEARSLFDVTPNPFANGARADAQALVELYEAWDRAEPGQGHDVQAAQCRASASPAAATEAGGDE